MISLKRGAVWEMGVLIASSSEVVSKSELREIQFFCYAHIKNSGRFLFLSYPIIIHLLSRMQRPCSFAFGKIFHFFLTICGFGNQHVKQLFAIILFTEDQRSYETAEKSRQKRKNGIVWQFRSFSRSSTETRLILNDAGFGRVANRGPPIFFTGIYQQ